MAGSSGEPSTMREQWNDDGRGTRVSAARLALLRKRIATNFYDRAAVIDVIARAILSEP